MRLNDDSIGYDKTKANKQGIISHFRKITPMVEDQVKLAYNTIQHTYLILQ